MEDEPFINFYSFNLLQKFISANSNHLMFRNLTFIRGFFAFILAALITVPLSAEQLKKGDSFPQIAAMDQHEKEYAVTDETSYVAVSFSMKSGKKANKYLSEKGADYLPENNAVFVANIFGMPGVGRFFALPKMRKYSHRILLADEEGLLDAMPTEDGKITVFSLDEKGSITSIQFWDPTSGEAPF